MLSTERLLTILSKERHFESICENIDSWGKKLVCFCEKIAATDGKEIDDLIIVAELPPNGDCSVKYYVVVEGFFRDACKVKFVIRDPNRYLNFFGQKKRFQERLENGFHLVYDFRLGCVELPISTSLKQFLEDNSQLHLLSFLDWFGFEYSEIKESGRNEIVGVEKFSGIAIISSFERFSSAFYFLRKKGHIEVIDDIDRVSYAYTKQFSGSLIKLTSESSNSHFQIGISYGYYQGDNPRDGSASFKVRLAILADIRRNYWESRTRTNSLPY